MSNLSSSVELEFPLAPTNTPQVVVKPISVANGFNVPILEDGAEVLLTGGFSPEHKDKVASKSTEHDELLSLADSLGGAYDAIVAVWPNMIPWIKAVVPAVADMGPRNPRSGRLSGSFAPGEPIYLTQVTNPLFHAEDVIHEVQHLRFIVTVPSAEWFGRWHESREIFISPYRPDLRPLSAIHLGLHAFVAVTEFRLRFIDQSLVVPTSKSELYDTHLRNVFALNTIVNHENLSSGGRAYYREMIEVLANQNRRIEAILSPPERKYIIDTSTWHRRPVVSTGVPHNASIDIQKVSTTEEIIGLMLT